MMTQFQEDTRIRTVFEIINSGGMERIGEAINMLINEAMKAERSSVLNAHPWERTEGTGNKLMYYKIRML